MSVLRHLDKDVLDKTALSIENTPMQNSAIFFRRHEKLKIMIFWIGGSNEYQQSVFWSKNKKNRYTPAYPSFAI